MGNCQWCVVSRLLRCKRENYFKLMIEYFRDEIRGFRTKLVKCKPMLAGVFFTKTRQLRS